MLRAAMTPGRAAHHAAEENQPGNNSSESPRRTPAATPNRQKSFQLPSILESPTGARYAVNRPLGKGGFASCYLVTDQATKKDYAAKVVLKASLTKSATREKLKSEIAIHKKLKHRYIVSFVESFDSVDAVYIILGLCENGTLTEMLRARKRLTPQEVQYFGLQLIEGLRYLHEDCLVLHRDLKLGNLMLTHDMELRIGDFGLAAELDSADSRRVTMCGTPNYIAPEVLDGKKTGGHSYEADIWGLGVVLYTLLVGTPPFETSNVKSTYKKIQECAVDFPDHVPVPSEFKDLIHGILQKVPERRLTLAEIQNHVFFRYAPPPSRLPVQALTKEPRNLPVSQMQAQTQPVATPTRQYYSASSTPAANTGATAVVPVKDEAVLRELYNRLEKSIADNKHLFSDRADPNAAPVSRSRPDSVPRSRSTLPPTVNVLKYVTLPNYGFGYLLSNGVLGIKFNDLTWISWPLNGAYFAYLERSNEATYPIAAGKYPSTLSKKVRLIETFKHELMHKVQNVNDLPEASSAITSSRARFVDMDWVRRHHQVDHAMFFRLGGGGVQLSFFDDSDLVFNCSTHLFQYTSKTGIREMISMDDVIENRRIDVFKRVVYLNKILKDCIDKTKAAN